MQQHKKFRSPEQGYSRAAMKARTSRAIQSTIEMDQDLELDHLAPDGIARLMLGADPERGSGTATQQELLPKAETTPITPQSATIDSGRFVSAQGVVTHVVRGAQAQPERAPSQKQGMIDRLLSMIRRSR